MTTIRIRATIDGVDKTWDDPTETQIFDLVSELNRRHRFLILDRVDGGDGERYMQICLSDDLGSYEIEYREGGPEAHFAAAISRDDEFGAHELAAGVLVQWAFGREGWQKAVTWQHLDFGA